MSSRLGLFLFAVAMFLLGLAWGVSDATRR